MITMPVPLAMALAALPTSSFTVSNGARASNFTAMHRRARSTGLRREPAGLVQWAQQILRSLEHPTKHFIEVLR